MKAGDRFKLHPKGSECVVITVDGSVVSFEQPDTKIKGKIDLDILKRIERIS